ncbi:MAG: hypothetical protein H0W72_14745 [Planctomycetes bacterium]|nr:hypothetical protein [Planctomycetota bacterium]
MPPTARTRTVRRTRPAQRTARTVRKVRRTSGGSGHAWMWWAGGLALSLIISLTIKLANKSTDDAQVRSEMHQVVQDFPNYRDHATYYDGLVERYHHQAFEAAYSMGGKRRAPTLNEKTYLATISSLMADKASADGKSEVATMLTTFNRAIREQ